MLLACFNREAVKNRRVAVYNLSSLAETHGRWEMKFVINFDKFLCRVFQQRDITRQNRALPSRAIETVNNVLIVFLFHQEYIEHFELALAAIMGHFVFTPTPIPNFHPEIVQVFQYHLNVAKGA
jgi:hypothetical protein